MIDLRFELTQGAFSLQIELSVEAPVLALVGPSGSGKTSVLESVAGLRTPARGHIAIDDTVFYDSARLIDCPVRLRRVGYVPQDVLLFPHLSVTDNILYGARGEHGVRELAALAPMLEIETLTHRRVSALSGGERQRVALARALLAEPRVLLLDEPLAAVDVPRRRRIAAALRRIREARRIPMVYVTHDLDEADALADWTVVLDAGRVLSSAPSARPSPP